MPSRSTRKNVGGSGRDFATVFFFSLQISGSSRESLPGDLWQADRAVRQQNRWAVPPIPLSFAWHVAPTEMINSHIGGECGFRSGNFMVATTVCSPPLVTVSSGGVRDYAPASERATVSYYIQGKGRMTVFILGPNAMTDGFQCL